MGNQNLSQFLCPVGFSRRSFLPALGVGMTGLVFGDVSPEGRSRNEDVHFALVRIAIGDTLQTAV